MRSKFAWANNELDDLLRQLDVALEASGIGIWQHNLLRNQTRWDEQLQRMYGVTKGEHDVVWLESVHPDDCAKANAIFEAAISGKSDYASQFRIIRPGGEIRHIRSRAKFFVDGKGEECFIGAEWDVTDDVERNEQLAREREAAEKSRAEAKYAAEHDYLTGLPNRRAFDAAFARLGTADVEMAVLCHIDVDHFKQINDRIGHAGGDAVLKHVAWVLSTVIRSDGVAARLGGDEFALLLAQHDLKRAQAIIRRIRLKLSQPIKVNGETVVVGISVGIAHASGSGIKSLLLSSDIALYQAKNRARGTDQVYTPALASKLDNERLMLQKLRRGLQTGEIVPHYQVQVTADFLSICGLEALARWESPEGIRAPSDFLGLASAHGLMEDIDDAILRRVLFDIRRWRMARLDVPRVSVNLSAARLSDPRLPEKLRALSMPERGLSFELIETIFLDTLSGQIKDNINEIRQLGIELEIDDLGSGHASLLGLLELRPDRVKIDRHLIRPLLENETQRRLITSLIDIARALNMTVVAEGVESMEHAAVLADLGADVLQGFAIGRPESAASIAARLASPTSAPLPSVWPRRATM